ncbi:uncharacterized protein ASPGLDRAFT_51240 [Aspergillus glaucus CBS 516.65]|uniref:Uncharacterized protein n=1 Tax=Aspergillus glaucus CBS 516.65 TaxID=1160497 RepID=A0A1L9VA96_ASPGL|nr:hypothetical protein ASPGLDRAFT_51240 [Aspergillus glaucus CBS 516.65]OJJ80795.1 hypothetical protein ASPGLDRAFT_51240 [Aspergillus glaucus CBS 516.65]
MCPRLTIYLPPLCEFPNYNYNYNNYYYCCCCCCCYCCRWSSQQDPNERPTRRSAQVYWVDDGWCGGIPRGINSRPDPRSLGNGPYRPEGVLLRVACRLAQLSLGSQLARNGPSTLSQHLV